LSNNLEANQSQYIRHKANIFGIKLNLPQLYNFIVDQFCKSQHNNDKTRLQTWSWRATEAWTYFSSVLSTLQHDIKCTRNITWLMHHN